MTISSSALSSFASLSSKPDPIHTHPDVTGVAVAGDIDGDTLAVIDPLALTLGVMLGDALALTLTLADGDAVGVGITDGCKT